MRARGVQTDRQLIRDLLTIQPGHQEARYLSFERSVDTHENLSS